MKGNIGNIDEYYKNISNFLQKHQETKIDDNLLDKLDDYFIKNNFPSGEEIRKNGIRS